MNKVLRWTAILIAAFGAVFNLPALILGSSFLWNWIRVQTSAGPYFRWEYLFVGMVCLLFSGSGLGLAARAIWKKNSSLLASVASLLLGLGCAVILPNVNPMTDMVDESHKILGHADHSLSDWDDANGKFPSSEEELRKALAVRPLKEPAIYFQQGKPISYDVQMVTNATGPSLGAVPHDPGTIVYAVSSNYRDYWLTITTLHDPARGPVELEHGFFDRETVWVMHREHHNPGEGHSPFIE